MRADHLLPYAPEPKQRSLEEKKIIFWKWAAIGFGAVFVINFLFDIDLSVRPRLSSEPAANATQAEPEQTGAVNENAVLPAQGVTLPVRWGDLGKRMTDAGVIDAQKFEALYAQRGGLDENTKRLLTGTDNGALVITQQNSGAILNLLWALGLGNKNAVLDSGPMKDPQYGGADKFASTGGWTLAKGSVMNHYSKHALVTLTQEQQALVERVAKNVYRPCCGNSTYFPDCNHGMAMLGLLELMAAQGVSEAQMYKTALAVNAYWFPDTYLTIAKYFAKRGVSWAQIDPKEALNSTYSSAQGYRQILSEVEPVKPQGGGGCGV